MAADETILTWNVTNWVSVILMAAIGFAILAIALKYFGGKKAAS